MFLDGDAKAIRREQGGQWFEIVPGERLWSWWSTQGLPHGLGNLAAHFDECSARYPCGQDDASVRSQHAGRLLGGGMCIRREDHTEHGYDDIDAGVLDGQRCRVAREELDLETEVRGSRSSDLQQSRRRINPFDAGTLLGGQQCRVPGPATEVENAFAGLQGGS